MTCESSISSTVLGKFYRLLSLSTVGGNGWTDGLGFPRGLKESETSFPHDVDGAVVQSDEIRTKPFVEMRPDSSLMMYVLIVTFVQLRPM